MFHKNKGVILAFILQLGARKRNSFEMPKTPNSLTTDGHRWTPIEAEIISKAEIHTRISRFKIPF